MGFIANMAQNDPLLNALGIIPKKQTPPDLPYAAPMESNTQTSAEMDAAAQEQAKRLLGGRTSTMLNGPLGVNDSKNTSKVLLGQ
jgi:hypothetical protein